MNKVKFYNFIPITIHSKMCADSLYLCIGVFDSLKRARVSEIFSSQLVYTFYFENVPLLFLLLQFIVVLFFCTSLIVLCLFYNVHKQQPNDFANKTHIEMLTLTHLHVQNDKLQLSYKS